VATITKPKTPENMSLPPAFPQSFYAALNKAAKKAGMTRSVFALKAIRFYSAALEKRKSQTTQALSAVDADKYVEMSSAVSKAWWDKVTPKEKTERAQKAATARWGKKKKQPNPKERA
jgi:hypothetical protein